MKYGNFICIPALLISFLFSSNALSDTKLESCHGCGSEQAYRLSAEKDFSMDTGDTVYVIDIPNRQIRKFNLQRVFREDYMAVQAVMQTVPDDVVQAFEQFVDDREAFLNDLQSSFSHAHTQGLAQFENSNSTNNSRTNERVDCSGNSRHQKFYLLGHPTVSAHTFMRKSRDRAKAFAALGDTNQYFSKFVNTSNTLAQRIQVNLPISYKEPDIKLEIIFEDLSFVVAEFNPNGNAFDYELNSGVDGNCNNIPDDVGDLTGVDADYDFVTPDALEKFEEHIWSFNAEYISNFQTKFEGGGCTVETRCRAIGDGQIECVGRMKCN